MRRRLIAFEHGASAVDLAAFHGGRPASSRTPPLPAGPDTFDARAYDAALRGMDWADDWVPAALRWCDRVSFALCGVALYLAAMPIWQAVRGALS